MTPPPSLAPIVIVDDDDDARRLVREFLTAAGLVNPVVEAVDGDAGLDLIRRTRPCPALVLVDLRMPGRDGLSLLAAVREEPELAHVPVVLLTGSGDHSHIEEAHRLGAASYLVKPVGFSALADVIRGLKLPWALHPASLDTRT